MAKTMFFYDKVVVISGGSSGLGLTLAKKLVVKGARVVLIARSKDNLQAAKVELESLRQEVASVSVYSADITDESGIAETLRLVNEFYGRIDMLINSAGVLAEGYFENQSLDVFKNVMSVNFIGTVNCVKAVLPYLKESQGYIVNVASMASLVGAFSYTSYSASKFAVYGFSESLRYELKPQGISVIVVCPPEFDGPMVDGITENRTPENKRLVTGVGVLSPEYVADVTLRGIERRRPVIITGFTAKATAILVRLFPAFARFLIHGMIKRVYQGPEFAETVSTNINK